MSKTFRISAEDGKFTCKFFIKSTLRSRILQFVIYDIFIDPNQRARGRKKRSCHTTFTNGKRNGRSFREKSS